MTTEGLRKISTIILDSESDEDRVQNIRFGLHSRRFAEFLIELMENSEDSWMLRGLDSTDPRSIEICQQFKINRNCGSDPVFFDQNHEVCMIRSSTVQIPDSEFTDLLGKMLRRVVAEIRTASENDNCRFQGTSFSVREVQLIGMLLSKEADSEIRKCGYSDKEIDDMKGVSEKNPVSEEIWKQKFKELKKLRSVLTLQQQVDVERLKMWARNEFRLFKVELSQKFREIVRVNQVEYSESILKILDGVENQGTVKFNRLLEDPEFFLDFGNVSDLELLMMTTGEC